MASNCALGSNFPNSVSLHILRDIKSCCMKILEERRLRREEKETTAQKNAAKQVETEDSCGFQIVCCGNFTNFVNFCHGYRVEPFRQHDGNFKFHKDKELCCFDAVTTHVCNFQDDESNVETSPASFDGDTASTSDYYSSISESKTSLDKEISNADLRFASSSATVKLLFNHSHLHSDCCLSNTFLSHDLNTCSALRDLKYPLQGINEEIFGRYFSGSGDFYIDSVACDKEVGLVFVSMKLEDSTANSSQILSYSCPNTCHTSALYASSSTCELDDDEATIEFSSKHSCFCDQCSRCKNLTSRGQQFVQDRFGLLRVLVRTELGVYHSLVPIYINLPEPKSFKNMISNAFVQQEVLNGVSKELGLTERLRLVKVAPEQFLEIDESFIKSKIKVGVLHVKEGQTAESDMFSNQGESREFSRFLSILGDRVKLKGFEKYNGGLDTLNGQSGDESVFTEWRNMQIMFHVSTLLPYTEQDPQRVQRKKHLGNDVVCLVFLESENTKFAPTSIRSQFLHSFIVVQCCKPQNNSRRDLESSRETSEVFEGGAQNNNFGSRSLQTCSVARKASDTSSYSYDSSASGVDSDATVCEEPEVFYNVSVVSRQAVPLYRPELPKNCRFAASDPQFREWILAKCVNGERASYSVARFSEISSRNRSQKHQSIFSSIQDQLATPPITRSPKVSSSGGWLRKFGASGIGTSKAAQSATSVLSFRSPQLGCGRDSSGGMGSHLHSKLAPSASISDLPSHFDQQSSYQQHQNQRSSTFVSQSTSSSSSTSTSKFSRLGSLFKSKTASSSAKTNSSSSSFCARGAKNTLAVNSDKFEGHVRRDNSELLSHKSFGRSLDYEESASMHERTVSSHTHSVSISNDCCFLASSSSRKNSPNLRPHDRLSVKLETHSSSCLYPGEVTDSNSGKYRKSSLQSTTCSTKQLLSAQLSSCSNASDSLFYLGAASNSNRAKSTSANLTTLLSLATESEAFNNNNNSSSSPRPEDNRETNMSNANRDRHQLLPSEDSIFAPSNSFKFAR